MPHFINRSERYLLSTSFKVLYTLLYHQPNLERLAATKLDLRTFMNHFGSFVQMPQYMLARDPYARLVSCFKDKFRQDPLRTPRSFDNLQDSQKLFCPFLAIRPDDPEQTIRDKLLSLTFAQFIQLLPELHMRDVHLRPQVMSKMIYYRGRPLAPLPVHKVLQIESPDDLSFLSDRLGIDTDTRHNCTDAIPLEAPWTNELRAIVNHLYRADFAKFGYRPIPHG